MWPRDAAEYESLVAQGEKERLKTIYFARDLARGENIVFCATAISDAPGLPGIKRRGEYTETHSILMRTRTHSIREIHTRHNLNVKTIRLRSDNKEHPL